MRLALVVVEEHARRAVHLRHDHPLGAVDHEGAVHGHERDVAHVDILLLDVLDRFGAGLLVDIEHDEAQRHLERSRIGHAALPALVDVVFGRLELVLDEFQHRRVGEIRDREHGLEHGLQALVGPAADRFLHQQKLVIGRLLNLDEVRHLCDFLDFPEKLTNALATCERLRHALSLTSSNRRDRDDSPEGRNPSRPSGQASSPRRSCMYDSARRRIRLIATAAQRSMGRFRDNPKSPFCVGRPPRHARAFSALARNPTDARHPTTRLACAAGEAEPRWPRTPGSALARPGISLK